MPESKKSPYQTGGMPVKFSEMRDGLTGFAAYLALPAMLPMRRGLGLRKLSLGGLFSMAFLMYLADSLSGTHVSLMGGVQTSGVGLLTYYAVAFLGFGLWERHKRWKDLRSGKPWHTYSLGLSYFEFLPLRVDRVYKNVDPAIAFIAGLCLKNLGFTAFGVAIMISAIAWRITEEHVYQRQLEDDLNTSDSLLEAKLHASLVEHLDKQQAPEVRSMRETGGIATGADAGLSEQIARRRKEAAAANHHTSVNNTGVYE